MVGRNKYDAFSYISQRIHNKLESWYAHLLSPAGKEIQIKSVATALPTYTMSCFLLPKILISKITGQIRKFYIRKTKVELGSMEKNDKILNSTEVWVLRIFTSLTGQRKLENDKRT